MQQIRESDNSSEEDFVYLGCTYSGECIVRIPFSSEQTSDCTLETKWSRRSKGTSRIFPLRCSPGLECSAVGRSQNPRNGHQALEWNRWTLHCIWSTTMDDTLKQRYAGNMYKQCPTAGYTNTGYGAFILHQYTMLLPVSMNVINESVTALTSQSMDRLPKGWTHLREKLI